MTRAPVPVVLALVAAMVVAPMAAMAMPGETTSPTASPAEAQPGEKLSGVVAVQHAEVDGEVTERTFAVRLARANNNSTKADVVADQVEDVDSRLQELEQRKQQLVEAHRNGSISTTEFRAEMAELAVRTKTVERLANRSTQAAQQLPADLLESKGINVTAIQQLANDARNLSGPAVARIAQSVGGADVGKSMGGQAKPGDRPDGTNRTGETPGDDRQGDRNETDANASAADAQAAVDRAASELQRAGELVERAEQRVGENDTEAMAALERARQNLTAAENALEDARAALQNGSYAEAVEQARTAFDHAEVAAEQANAALDARGNGGA